MKKKYYERCGRRFVQVELPQQHTVTTDNAGKYYQTDGSFVAERTKDSIGLCILSSNNNHVVMALQDCQHPYTYWQAVKVAKTYFKGYGRIPTLYEMFQALERFPEKLKLNSFVTYTIESPSFGGMSISLCATTAGVGVRLFDHSWKGFAISFRPVVTINKE